MNRISVRMKLSLLIVISILALAVVGLSGWFGLQRVAASLQEVSDQSLAAVRLLGALRTSRLEAIVAVQEGAAWKINEFETLMPDRAELLAEGRAVFMSILERYAEAGERSRAAFESYRDLPKSGPQTTQWEEVLPLWEDFSRTDDRQAVSPRRTRLDEVSQQEASGVQRWGRSSLILLYGCPGRRASTSFK